MLPEAFNNWILKSSVSGMGKSESGDWVRVIGRQIQIEVYFFFRFIFNVLFFASAEKKQEKYEK